MKKISSRLKGFFSENEYHIVYISLIILMMSILAYIVIQIIIYLESMYLDVYKDHYLLVVVIVCLFLFLLFNFLVVPLADKVMDKYEKIKEYNKQVSKYSISKTLRLLRFIVMYLFTSIFFLFLELFVCMTVATLIFPSMSELWEVVAIYISLGISYLGIKFLYLPFADKWWDKYRKKEKNYEYSKQMRESRGKW